MDASARQALEAELRTRFDAGDLDGAMTGALRAYGAELYGLLCGLTRDATLATDLFGEVCERLWRGFPTFRWDASFRVWAYSVTRNTFFHFRRDQNRRPRPAALSELPSIAAVVAEVRSSTPVHEKTEVKDAFARLRETLEPDDQMLLSLRVERAMAWDEISEILGVASPALRKRFQRLTRRLRALADELPSGG